MECVCVYKVITLGITPPYIVSYLKSLDSVIDSKSYTANAVV